jgi:hypothetical protein
MLCQIGLIVEAVQRGIILRIMKRPGGLHNV